MKTQIDFAHDHKFKQNRKNNDMVLAAYEVYLSGKSLQYIANKLYGGKFTRQNLFDLFRVRGYKMRSKSLLPARIHKGVSYRPAHGGYRSRQTGKLTFLHKVIWEEHNGPVPPGHYILFKDGDKENIVIENLFCISSKEAKKLYNYANQNGYRRFPGKGQFGK